MIPSLSVNASPQLTRVDVAINVATLGRSAIQRWGEAAYFDDALDRFDGCSIALNRLKRGSCSVQFSGSTSDLQPFIYRRRPSNA